MSKISNKQLKKIRGIESAISKNLFRICSVITVITMIMILTEFFSRGFFPPPQIGLFYIGVLLIYSFHKEMLRWMGQKWGERHGEWFLYSWIGLALALYIINFVTRNYFSDPSGEATVRSLSEVSIITFEVSVIFIFTRLSKTIKLILNNLKK